MVELDSVDISMKDLDSSPSCAIACMYSMARNDSGCWRASFMLPSVSR